MSLPVVKLATVYELRRMFGWNEEVTTNKNISILTEKFLISLLEKNGYSFDFTVAKKEKGKPYFLYNDKVYFSVSHTQGIVAVAIHDSEIGLDIEQLRSGKRAVAQRFFHPDEVKYLDKVSKTEPRSFDEQYQMSNIQYDNAFTQLWTIKEAYVKMTGTGIADNFSSLDLSPQTYKENQCYRKYNTDIISYYDTQLYCFVSMCAENLNVSDMKIN